MKAYVIKHKEKDLYCYYWPLMAEWVWTKFLIHAVMYSKHKEAEKLIEDLAEYNESITKENAKIITISIEIVRG